jgi:hypothetical protein
MARFPLFSASAWATVFVLLNTLIPSVRADNPSDTVQVTDSAGNVISLPVDRFPALYTGNFGDCMGGQSLINVTSFDAAYYADNMTVLFNLAGTSNLRNESLMCK